MRPLAAIAAVAAVLIAAGCGSSSDSAKTVSVASPSGSISAEQGDTLALSFHVDPGVGYDWLLRSNQPKGLLVRSGDHTVADTEGAVGGPATHTYTFEARRAGSAKLDFRHYFRGKVLADRIVRIEVSSSG